MPPQRLSNEDDETTGAAPVMALDVAGGDALPNESAFAGAAGAAAGVATWAIACSGFALSGLAASGFGFATA
jgi:hypothetical protein